MSEPQLKKTCFVICPIGEKETATRRRSDQILRHIITPVVNECGYQDAERADRIPSPGVITSQIVQRVIASDLVVADLTERNPNVFYELAVRHAVRKPVIHIMEDGEDLPFDVASMRLIRVNHTDLDSVENCKNEMLMQIRAMEAQPDAPLESPISMAVDIEQLRSSPNLIERTNAEIIALLHVIRLELANLRRRQDYPWPTWLVEHPELWSPKHEFPTWKEMAEEIKRHLAVPNDEEK